MSEAPRGDARERLTALEEKLRALERELLDGNVATEEARSGHAAATAVAQPPESSTPPAGTGARTGREQAGREPRPWRWIVLLATVVALAAAGVCAWTARSGDEEQTGRAAPAAAGSVTTTPAAPHAVVAVGAVPPALRAVLPAGVTIVPGASRRAALAAVCDGRADAAALAAAPARLGGSAGERPGGGSCSVTVAAAVPTSATVLIAPRGGCVGPRRARRLAASPGRLDARRTRAASAAGAATRRRLRDAAPARRDAAARRAAAAARARFDARHGLAPVAIRVADGRCVTPTRTTVVSGGYPLGRRATIVAASGDVERVAGALRRPSGTPVPARTVAVGALR